MVTQKVVKQYLESVNLKVEKFGKNELNKVKEKASKFLGLKGE